MLFSQMEPLPGFEGRFHHWYDTEHVPVRVALPGFLRARRYRALEGRPEFLAIYDVVDTLAFQSPGFRELRSNPSAQTKDMLGNVTGLTRFICEEAFDSGPSLHGQRLLVVALDIDAPAFVTFDEWCTEFAPSVAHGGKGPRVRCYRVVDGGDRDWSHIVLHEMMPTPIVNGSVVNGSADSEMAVVSAAWDGLARQPWVRNSGRWLYSLIAEAKGADGDYRP
jgi:hypothetical protein